MFTPSGAGDHTLPNTQDGLLTTDAAGTLVTRRVRVLVTHGPDRDRHAPLARGTLVVGTGVGADLVLTDGRVSRRHVELAMLPRGVRVRDLESRNGTWCGTQRLHSAVVQVGTELTLGQSRLLLVPEDAPVELTPELTHFGALVGRNPAIRRAFDVLAAAAHRDAAILIEGEQGTGKTEAARAVHETSPRRAEVLHTLALGEVAPAELAAGFDAAERGTLVLDRIDLAGAATARTLYGLLCEVEEGRRDVRLVSTSRCDLRERVTAGALPRDLYFQVAVVRVTMPPLRDHLEDVPLIVSALARQRGVALPETSAALLGEGLADGIPANVRALRNALERMAVQGEAYRAEPDPAAPPVGDYKERKQAAIDAFQRSYLEALVTRHGEDVAAAAQEAGIDKAYLARLLARHGL